MTNETTNTATPKGPDYSTWARPTLERLVAEVVAENAALRADLRLVIDAYRREIK